MTPITLNLYWTLSKKWTWKSWRLRFKLNSYNIMKEREAKVELVAYEMSITIYITKNIQDDSERWDPSITKTSLQISAHFLQYYSSLWMIRSSQSELYNSCLYFFKVILNYIVLCNFFYIFIKECQATWKRPERIVFFADSKMDVLTTIITVFLVLFPVIIKAQQNIQGIITTN